MPQPELAWKSGVVFERDGTSVLVQTADNGREIHLRARGPEKKALLSVIASDLDALNDSFEGLGDKVDKWVPCCCSECSASDSPELFSERKLRKRRQHGIQEDQCETSYQPVSVMQLLDGVEVSRMPSWAAAPAEETRSPMADEKPDGGVHFNGPVTVTMNDSAIQTGKLARFENHSESTAQFAKDLEAVHAQLLSKQTELGETVVEALGNMLRKLAQVQAADTAHVDAVLKKLQDDVFIKEVLPQLRSGAINWESITKAAKVTGETAKALGPVVKLLAAVGS